MIYQWDIRNSGFRHNFEKCETFSCNGIFFTTNFPKLGLLNERTRF